MATRALGRSEWQAYFDRVARRLPSEQVEIEVAGLDLGDQFETEWVILQGVSYDPKDDLFSVFLPGVEHNVPKPKAILVDDDVDGLHSIEVVDSDGRRHMIRLKQLLKLPAA